MSDRDLAKARAEADAARAALVGTAHTLQARLMPSTLAEQAWDNAREKGSAAAARAADVARRQPVATAAAAAAALLFLTRKPLGRLIRRLRGKQPRPAKRSPRRLEGDRS